MERNARPRSDERCLRVLPSGADGLPERALCPGSSVLLRFLALNLSSPSRGYTGAPQYKSVGAAQPVGIVTARPDTLRAGLSMRSCLQRARPTHETKWLVLCSVRQFTSGGGARLGRGCDPSRVATITRRRH